MALQRSMFGRFMAGTAAALIVTAGIGIPRSAAADPPTDPPAEVTGAMSADVTITEAEYEQLMAEGKQREAGKLKSPVSPGRAAQSSTRSAASAVAPEPALEVATAAQQARLTAAQHFDKNTADVGAVRSGRISTQVAAPIGTEPDQARLEECFEGDGADDAFGRVLNRFTYCQSQRWTVNFYRVLSGVRVLMGTSYFDHELFAQGDDHARRIRAFARVEEDSVEHHWAFRWEERWVAPYLPFSLVVNCVEGLDRCTATRSPVIMPFIAWDNNDDWFYWDVYNHEGSGVFRDKISYNRFELEGQAFGYGVSDSASTAPRMLRCDSADYMKHGDTVYPQACIFAEATPHLPYEMNSDYRSVALHIFEALEHPNETRPLLAPEGVPPSRSKVIPGKYDPGNASAPGLHRIFQSGEHATEHTNERQANENHKQGACYKEGPESEQYLETGLPVRPNTPDEQCDEFPFGSTLEGAGNLEWDFSVKAVPQRDNSVAGGRLRAWFTDDRILAWDVRLPSPFQSNDMFFVEIK